MSAHMSFATDRYVKQPRTQDTVTLEVRCKSIPVPKAAAAKPKAKAKAKASAQQAPKAAPKAAGPKRGRR